jgi:hypothetical protein
MRHDDFPSSPRLDLFEAANRSVAAKAIHTTAGNTCGPRKTRGLDQYETPTCAIEALLRVEPLPHGILEPCAGSKNRNIVATLKARGHSVEAYDLAADGIDFLKQTTTLPGIDGIVTSPPFCSAEEFITHGLTLVPLVIVLERIQFLEARVKLWAAGKLARIWFFQNRVPRMDEANRTGKKASAGMSLAWFVFLREHDGSAPRLDWIRWRRP